jgi:hypothetical protein
MRGIHIEGGNYRGTKPKVYYLRKFFELKYLEKVLIVLINIKDICGDVRGRLLSKNISLYSYKRSVLDLNALQHMKAVYVKRSKFFQFCFTVMNCELFISGNKVNDKEIITSFRICRHLLW